MAGPGHDDSRSRQAVAALVLLTLVAYLPVFSAGFVDYDDPSYVLENRHVLGGVRPEGIRWALTAGEEANWHPATWVSHMLDVSLFGLNPVGHHATSLLLHLANTALLMRLLWRTTGRFWPAWAVAALFALHPLHVESVAWVAERKDVLSTFFGLLALGAYHRYTLRPRPGRYLAVVLWFALGLAAKPMLVTLPCVLLLFDYWPLARMRGAPRSAAGQGAAPGNRIGPLHLVLEKLPLFALALASCLVTYRVQQLGGAVRSFETLPLDVRLANAMVSYVAYLAKAVWPVDLAAYYPFRIGFARTWGGAAGLVLAAVSLLVLRLARRHPYAAMGWLWYLGTLVPVIGIVQVGTQAMADRYTYLPLVGAFVVLAYGAAELQRRGLVGRRTLAVCGGVLLAAAIPATARQAAHWQTPVRLTERMIQVTLGRSEAAYNLLGTALIREGRRGEAEAAFRRALALKGDYYDARYNLANLLAEAGRTDEALHHYRRALAMNPDDRWGHNNLGALLLRTGRPEAAAAHFRRALQLDPSAVEVRGNLGAALLAAGRTGEALADLQRAAGLSTNPGLQRNLGVALMAAGRFAEAEAHFERLLRAEPGDAATRRHLARLRRLRASH